MTYTVRQRLNRMAAGRQYERLVAAQDPLCPKAALAALAQDPAQDLNEVRWAALKNPSLPVRVMSVVVTAGLAVVRELAEPAPYNYPAAGLNLMWLLGNPALPERQLSRVAARILAGPTDAAEPLSWEELIVALLSHPNCARQWLEVGMTGWHESYRSCVAGNPNVPLDLAERLLRSEHSTVRSHAVQNEAIPPSLLTGLAAKEGDGVVLHWLLPRLPAGDHQAIVDRVLASITDPRVYRTPNQQQLLRVVAAQFSRDAAQVTALCWDDAPMVRRTAARNPVAIEQDRVAVALRQATS